jgi:hypothetical protein
MAFKFALFPHAKDADNFGDKVFQLHQLASLLNVNPKDSMFVDHRGQVSPYRLLVRYIFDQFELAGKQPNKFKHPPNDNYVAFDPSFYVVNTSASQQHLTIYMNFEKNRKPEAKLPWVFKGWCVGWDQVIHQTTIVPIKEEEKMSVPVTIPDDFICPITQDLMVDPVVAADGHTYDRVAIAEWFAGHSTSPMTGAKLTVKKLYPNHTVRGQILTWKEAQSRKSRAAAQMVQPARP